MDIFETDFNGWLYKVKLKTKGIGCAFSDDIGPDAQLEYFKNLILILKNSFEEDLKLYVISYFRKAGKFNCVEKYYGIWKALNKKNIVFANSNHEVFLEKNGESWMSAYAEINENEIKNLLKMQFPIIVFANETVMSDLFSKEINVLNDPELIKSYLLQTDSIIVEIADLCDEGFTIFIYSKSDNDKFDSKKVMEELKHSL